MADNLLLVLDVFFARQFECRFVKISIPASVLLVLAVLQGRFQRLLPPDITYLTYIEVMNNLCSVVVEMKYAAPLNQSVHRLERIHDLNYIR